MSRLVLVEGEYEWLGKLLVFCAIAAAIIALVVFAIYALIIIGPIALFVFLMYRAHNATNPTLKRILQGVAGVVACIYIAAIIYVSIPGKGLRIAVLPSAVMPNAQAVDYNALLHHELTLKDKPVVLNGRVGKVVRDGDYIDVLCNFGRRQSVLVSYKYGADTSMLNVGDQVMVWGIAKGFIKYKDDTIPAVVAGYIRTTTNSETYKLVGRVSKAGNTAYTVKSLDRSIVMGQSVAQPGKAFLTVTVGVTHRKYKTLTIPCAQTQPCAIVGIDGISCPEPIPVTAENLSFTPAIGGTEGGVCTAVFTDVRYPYKSVTLRFYSLRLHEDGSSDADTSVSSDYNCILSDDARMIEVSATP